MNVEILNGDNHYRRLPNLLKPAAGGGEKKEKINPAVKYREP